MRDTKLFDLIEKEKIRQTEGIELIASENYASEDVMAAAGSILTNKYAEGLPGKRYYGGCVVVDEIEDLCRERLKKLFDASWVNVQPHSGAQANAAVMLALLSPGDKISLLSPEGREKDCIVHAMKDALGNVQNVAKKGDIVFISPLGGISIKTLVFKD